MSALADASRVSQALVVRRTWLLRAACIHLVVASVALCGGCSPLPYYPDGANGCEIAADEGPVELLIHVDGRRRTYWLVVPDGYEPHTPMPTVFGWHGRGGEADMFRAYAGLEGPANGEAIFVYPQGLPTPGIGLGMTGWDLSHDGRDVAFFDAMLEQLDDQNCVDRSRVDAAGHSFGGYFTNALGCFRPDDLRAIGSVAGGPPAESCEAGTVAAILIHGDRDEIVDVADGRRARDEQLSRNGCSDETRPVDPAPCVAYDGCNAGEDVVWCEHDESALEGHAWPDFAGEAIWDFFAAQSPK
jgi:poly(3-hydroxybutyrate) depolymerase